MGETGRSSTTSVIRRDCWETSDGGWRGQEVQHSVAGKIWDGAMEQRGPQYMGWTRLQLYPGLVGDVALCLLLTKCLVLYRFYASNICLSLFENQELSGQASLMYVISKISKTRRLRTFSPGAIRTERLLQDVSQRQFFYLKDLDDLLWIVIFPLNRQLTWPAMWLRGRYETNLSVWSHLNWAHRVFRDNNDEGHIYGGVTCLGRYVSRHVLPYCLAQQQQQAMRDQHTEALRSRRYLCLHKWRPHRCTSPLHRNQRYETCTEASWTMSYWRYFVS